jgi:hypothetical protein
MLMDATTSTAGASSSSSRVCHVSVLEVIECRSAWVLSTCCHIITAQAHRLMSSLVGSSRVMSLTHMCQPHDSPDRLA